MLHLILLSFSISFWSCSWGLSEVMCSLCRSRLRVCCCRSSLDEARFGSSMLIEAMKITKNISLNEDYITTISCSTHHERWITIMLSSIKIRNESTRHFRTLSLDRPRTNQCSQITACLDPPRFRCSLVRSSTTSKRWLRQSSSLAIRIDSIQLSSARCITHTTN